MTDKDKMRESFEAWFNSGDVRRAPTKTEFAAWQAAKESDRKELEAAKQRVAELEVKVNGGVQ